MKDDSNKGVVLLHSFWSPEAIKTFEGILARNAKARWTGRDGRRKQQPVHPGTDGPVEGCSLHGL